FAAEVAALGSGYVDRLVLSEPAGLWLDEHQPLDFYTAAPDDFMRALFVDVEAAMARRPAPDPEDHEAVTKATLERHQSMAASSKFTWPIWDKGLKKRLH